MAELIKNKNFMKKGVVEYLATNISSIDTSLHAALPVFTEAFFNDSSNIEILSTTQVVLHPGIKYKLTTDISLGGLGVSGNYVRLQFYNVTSATYIGPNVTCSSVDSTSTATIVIIPSTPTVIEFRVTDTSITIADIAQAHIIIEEVEAYSSINTFNNQDIVSVASGWVPAVENWTYASSDAPTFQIAIPGDKTDKYSKGTKLKLNQMQPISNYWPLTSDSNDVIGSLNGVATDVTFTPGSLGNMATFNGTSAIIELPHNAALMPVGDFTVSARIKTTTSGVIFSAFNQTTDFVNSGVVVGIDYYKGTAFLTSTKNTSENLSVGSSTILTDNVEHIVVFTMRGNIGAVYVDGKLENSGVLFNPIYTPSIRIFIGGYIIDTFPGYYFLGQISDVFMDNKYAWDEATVLKQYQKNAPQGISPISITKHFVITKQPEYTSPNTVLTVYGGTEFSLSDSVIALPYYSNVQNPFGFDRSPEKWRILSEAVVRTSYSAASITWTGVLGGAEITVPEGDWEIESRSILVPDTVDWVIYKLYNETTATYFPFTFTGVSSPVVPLLGILTGTVNIKKRSTICLFGDRLGASNTVYFDGVLYAPAYINATFLGV